MESIKQNKAPNSDIENRLVIARERQGVGVSGMGEGGQKIQTFSYKRSPRDVMYSLVPIASNILMYVWKLLRK